METFRARSAVHRELGNVDLAVGMIGEALELHEAIGARGEVMADLLELARLRAQQSGDADAAAHLRRADSLAVGLDSDRARIEVALTRAQLAEERDEPRVVLAALGSVSQLVADASVDHRWRWAWLEARALHRLGSREAAASARRAVDLVEQIRTSLDSRLLAGSLLQDRAESYRTLVEILLEEGLVDEAFEVSDRARGRDLVRQVAVESTRRQVLDTRDVLAERGGHDEIVAAADSLDARLIEVEEGLFQMRLTGTGQDGIRYPSRLMGRLTYLFTTVGVADFRPTDQEGEVHVILEERLDAIAAALEAVLNDDLEEFNRMIQSLGMRVVS